MSLQVQCAVEQLTLPTYREPDAELMPMFAENRVHQRSTGNPYPNRVVLDVDREHREEKTYTAIRLENDFIRLVLLPELGGRIYSAYDKVNGYDFFYKQHVVKPALIGLLGSWVSGGVEFNWPCHHRPSTYMPTEYSIEHEASGAVTVWMSEHEPMDRMKGMVGIRLAPDEAAFKTLMRVYNRTDVRHSFLWWENAAVPVNKQYRLFFPHDVSYVQFHYRKDVTTYPLASGVYNGINMGVNSVDIRMHKNTHQPTSYFCGETREDFFGGYDEGKQCGVVHVADRHTSIGKKMFTWAYNQLSQSWENALTDTDGAYAELMASSYSANQPDFAWLEPYETKKFTQSWYPIGAMGVPDCATYDAAIRLAPDGIHLQTTKPHAALRLLCDDTAYTLETTPCTPAFVPCGMARRVKLTDEEGRVLLAYAPAAPDLTRMPDRLPTLLTLDQLRSAQDAYLAGVHVDQYRDPTVRPDSYFAKALELDPFHIPTLTAMARYQYQMGNLSEAQSFASRALKAATAWNFHPESGEIEYLLGLIDQAMRRDEEAADHFHRAHWNEDRRAASMTQLSCLAGRQGEYAKMLSFACDALDENADNGLAVSLAAVAEFHLGQAQTAAARLCAWLKEDPLDYLASCVLALLQGAKAEDCVKSWRCDPAQVALDVAIDLCSMGETGWAAQLLCALPTPTAMTGYARALLTGGDPAALREASDLPFGMAYPSRMAEELILGGVLAVSGQDATALFGMGCLLYSKRRYDAAVSCWEKALHAAPDRFMTLRCLAVAYYSHADRQEEALTLLKEALSLRPGDPQLIWETVYVMQRLGVPAQERLSFLKANCTGSVRDDIALLWAQALNESGAYAQTLDLMTGRSFVPCEGGEHAVADQYMFAHYAIGRELLAQGRTEEALSSFRAAQQLPQCLGAGLWNEVKLVPHQFCEALCLEHLGRQEEAEEIFRHICGLQRDFFSDMHLQELPCYQAMAHIHLGHAACAQEMLIRHIRAYRQAECAADPGFFASTPFFISYTEDAAMLRRRSCIYQQAFGFLSLGREDEAKKLLAKTPADPANLFATLFGRLPFPR